MSPSTKWRGSSSSRSRRATAQQPTHKESRDRREHATTLAGAGEGALAGGVIGAIFGKLVEKEHIPRLEQRLKAGKYLVVARGDRAHEVIQDSAASEVETHDGGSED